MEILPVSVRSPSSPLPYFMVAAKPKAFVGRRNVCRLPAMPLLFQHVNHWFDRISTLRSSPRNLLINKHICLNVQIYTRKKNNAINLPKDEGFQKLCQPSWRAMAIARGLLQFFWEFDYVPHWMMIQSYTPPPPALNAISSKYPNTHMGNFAENNNT